MRPFKDEFHARLEDVQRWWIRIPATLGLTIGVVLAGMILGGVEAFIKFTWPCLKGPERKL